MAHLELELFGTTTIGIKICSMVILAAEGLASVRDGKSTKSAKENIIKLEWVTHSIFVARGGYTKHSTNVIKKVRQICKDTPPGSFEEVVRLFVEEANNELKTIEDAENTKYTFTIGGRLHREHDCHLFLVKRVASGDKQNPYLYVSDSGNLFAPGQRGEEFFSKDDIKLRLQQAEKGYDRAELAAIVKEFLTFSCVKHQFNKGRAAIVTIDERGFHIFESAYPILYDDPARGYKASEVDGFYPEGYPKA